MTTGSRWVVEWGGVRGVLANLHSALRKPLVLLAIVSILVGVGLGFYAGYVENARVTRVRHQLYTIQSACESFYAVRRVYPASAGELGEAGFPAAGDGPFALEARDPWGRPYQYRADDGAGAYVLETGYNRVQGVAGRVVLASGGRAPTSCRLWARSGSPGRSPGPRVSSL